MADEENTQLANTPVEHTQEPAESATPPRASDRPPERLVRHVFGNTQSYQLFF
jgi:hypothetical protein